VNEREFHTPESDREVDSTMIHAKLEPKRADGLAMVLSLGRVSTEGQQLSNIEAGHDYAEAVLKQVHSGPAHVKRLGEQGSGMLVERAAILEAYEEILSGKWDLVLMEDVSKAYRNPRWIYAFVQDCVDNGVRVIAPGDSLDTADENWEVVLGTAALRHGLHIPDTRRRVRRTGIKAFNDGGMVLRVRFGYRKLTKEDADSGAYGPKGLRLALVPAHTPIIRELRRLVLEERKCGAALADWLDEQGVELPPYVKAKRWKSRHVLALLRDPILAGIRQYPKVNYRPRFADGKHNRERNPSPNERRYPELAHVTPEEFDELQVGLKAVCGDACGPSAGSNNPRTRVPRHKSISPLQHAACHACAAFYYPTGSGQIKCKNAFSHRPGSCWNHVQVDGERVRAAMVDVLLDVVNGFPGAPEALIDATWSELKRSRSQSARGAQELAKHIADLKRRRKRLARAIESGGRIKPLVRRLKATERLLRKAMRKRKKLTQSTGTSLPTSREALAIEPRDVLRELGRSSYEFAALLRRIIPSLVIQPVQALDSGLVRPRAVITLDLSVLVPHIAKPAESERPLRREIVVDLFDPPVHIHHLNAIVEFKRAKTEVGEKSSLSVIAEALKVNRMTAKRALAYERLMQKEGLTEPYRVLATAPTSASRWKPSVRRGQKRSACAPRDSIGLAVADLPTSVVTADC
jgi:hypothetical protein